ncbi:MAG: alpha/beta hydrolase [Chitinophagaceae bacterium]|nr:MAG: alpha/beta hydrolase [Chitinophagaceae bacterium]
MKQSVRALFVSQNHSDMRILFFLLLLLSGRALGADRQFYFTTSDSVRLYVRVAGEGKPCVFLHGGPGSNAYYYEAMPAAPLIEQQLQMVYFDQRGCGRSSSPRSGDFTMARMLQDLEELRAHLGFRKWAVMGHSFGGILEVNYAHRFPASVSALMLIHATLNMQFSMQSHLEFGLKELNITDQAAYRDSTKPLIGRVSMVHSRLTEKGVWYKLMYRNAFEKKYNDSVSSAIGEVNYDYANKVWEVKDYWTDFTPLTASVKCPVLVMTGDRDHAIGLDHYKSFRFPHPTVLHYIGGHAPFQEEPQWFAEKILSFVPSIR